jgi:hypothetical protein
MQGEEEDFYIPMHAPGISAKNLDGLTALYKRRDASIILRPTISLDREIIRRH